MRQKSNILLFFSFLLFGGLLLCLSHPTPASASGKRHLGLGTQIGGGVRFHQTLPSDIPFPTNAQRNLTLSSVVRLPTVEWTWFHEPSQSAIGRALSIYITPTEALFYLFRKTDGAPHLALHAGLVYTFHFGGPVHSFYVGPGLEGGFSNDGSLANGEITLLLRIGYEYLYGKGRFGLRVCFEPFFQFERGGIEKFDGIPTSEIRFGAQINIAFFSYSLRIKS